MKLRRLLKILNKRYEQENISIENIDTYFEECRKLLKSVLESQAYIEFHDYQTKVQIWTKLHEGLDQNDKSILNNISTQFWLNVNRKEQEFREKCLKPIANKVNCNLEIFKEEFKNKLIEMNTKMEQMNGSTKNDIRELYDKIQGENIEKFIAENVKIETLKNTISEDDKRNRDNLNEIEQKLSNIDTKIDNFIKNQSKANKNINKMQVELSKNVDNFIKVDFENKIKEIEDNIKTLSQNEKNINLQQIQTNNLVISLGNTLFIESYKTSL